MEETRNAYRNVMGKPLGKVHLEDQEGDGRITLSYILESR
jgi:hypothetical protein